MQTNCSQISTKGRVRGRESIIFSYFSVKKTEARPSAWEPIGTAPTVPRPSEMSPVGWAVPGWGFRGQGPGLVL